MAENSIPRDDAGTIRPEWWNELADILKEIDTPKVTQTDYEWIKQGYTVHVLKRGQWYRVEEIAQ
jgi:hypothetical protein